jgi:hypothetical protein
MGVPEISPSPRTSVGAVRLGSIADATVVS